MNKKVLIKIIISYLIAFSFSSCKENSKKIINVKDLDISNVLQADSFKVESYSKKINFQEASWLTN